MNIKPLKKEYSVKITEFINGDGRNDHLYNVDEVGWLVWKNPIDKNSLRLHAFGYNSFKKIGMKGAKFKLPPEQLITKTFLLLDQKICGPYYLSSSKIVVFDDRDVLMLSLLTGNLLQYLEKHSYR